MNTANTYRLSPAQMAALPVHAFGDDQDHRNAYIYVAFSATRMKCESIATQGSLAIVSERAAAGGWLLVVLNQYAGDQIDVAEWVWK